MKKSLPVFIICVTCSLVGFTQKKKTSSTGNFTVQQLAPGVWAAIHNDQYGKAFCNAGIVDLGDKTLVFDAFMTPAAAEELKAVAEELTRKPVTILVNSHYHNDHIRGNQVFAPYATIISTNYTRNKIAETELEGQRWERENVPGLLKATKRRYNSAIGIDKDELPLWIGYYEGIMESLDDLKMTLPDIVFDDSLWILGTERHVKLTEYKNGHTGSDIVLCLPAERIAFTGDLLFVQRHPWLCDGEPVSWQANLDRLYADKYIQTYVPGHGPICEKKGVKELHDYLGMMQSLATEANEDSLKASAVLTAIPVKYQNWYFGRFYQPNIKHLMSIRSKETITPQ